MGEIAIGSGMGGVLGGIIGANDITPGDPVSYQTCKDIFLWHPLGFKIAGTPVKLAMSDPREITVASSPGDRCVKAFCNKWEEMGNDNLAASCLVQARVYGAASLALVIKDKSSMDALDYFELPDLEFTISVLDPMNTAGSLVTNQNPNAIDFQKHDGIDIAGVPYHRSRSVTVYNEMPIYISYSQSAFGFVGRSIFQRSLYMLKSFLKSLRADDLIETKVGVLVAKIKPAGTIANAIAKAKAMFARNVIQEAETGNVINVQPEEEIESLNLQNLEGPHTLARKNILENIASASPMPAMFLTEETMSSGLADGTEDAARIAHYIEDVRKDLRPIMRFLDRICMHMAWTEEFYQALKNDFPEEFAGKSYKTAFLQWREDFTATWPSLMQEPEGEGVRVDDVRLKAVIALIQVLVPMLDTDNQVVLLQWATDCISSAENLFPSELEFDWEDLRGHLEEMADQEAQAKEAATMGGPEGAGGGEGGGAAKIKMGKADAIDRWLQTATAGSEGKIAALAPLIKKARARR